MRWGGWVALLLVGVAGTAPGAEPLTVGDGGPGPVKAQHVTVELTANSQTITPGETIEVGVVLAMEEHWHALWVNAGEEGEPPRVSWTLPPGVTAGPMRYPIPGQVAYGDRTDYGYEYAIAFPVAVTAARDLRAGRVHLDGVASWVVCSEVCVPGRAHLGLELPVTKRATPLLPPVGALGDALALLPKPVPEEMRGRGGVLSGGRRLDRCGGRAAGGAACRWDPAAAAACGGADHTAEGGPRTGKDQRPGGVRLCCAARSGYNRG